MQRDTPWSMACSPQGANARGSNGKLVGRLLDGGAGVRERDSRLARPQSVLTSQSGIGRIRSGSGFWANCTAGISSIPSR
jgi:hypothetical protein